MSQAQHDALLHNVNALIEGLQPNASDARIASILAAIQPTYEHVASGSNTAEIAELSQILKDMNKILSKYRKVSSIIEQFDQMRASALAESHAGIQVGISIRLAIIDMILYHDVWLAEQARLEGARNIEARARQQSAAEESYYRSPEQVAARADAHRRQQAKALHDAAAAAGAAAGAAEAEELRNLAASMGDEVYAAEMAGQIMAMKKFEASRGKKKGEKKGGKKSHKRSNKKGGKKSHKKRSHRRRH